MLTLSPASRDIAVRMDELPVKALHVLLAAVCGLGLGFDMYEMMLGSALSAVFSAPPHVLPARELSWLLSSVYVGAIFGTPVLGWCADRFGRRWALAGILFWVGLVSLAITRSHGTAELTVLRGLSGVGLGAYPPLMMAYLADLLPPGRRGLVVFGASGLATLGPPSAIFLVRALTPARPLGVDAWRWAFGVGGVGALLVALAFLLLPESPRWLYRKGRSAEANGAYRRFESSRTVLSASVAPPASLASASPAPALGPTRRRTLTALLSLLAPWANTGFPLIVGAVLAQKGFKLPDTLLFMGLGLLGPAVGSLVAAPWVDRWERRVALAFLSTGTAFAIATFVMSSAPAVLVAAYFSFGLFAALYIPTLSLYVAELFPTEQRARSSSSAWTMNRVASALAPLVLVPLVRSHGPLWSFSLLALLWVATVGVLSLAPAGQQRRAIG